MMSNEKLELLATIEDLEIDLKRVTAERDDAKARMQGWHDAIESADKPCFFTTEEIAMDENPDYEAQWVPRPVWEDCIILTAALKARIEAAEKLCKIYFEIAENLVGDEKVREIRDKMIDTALAAEERTGRRLIAKKTEPVCRHCKTIDPEIYDGSCSECAESERQVTQMTVEVYEERTEEEKRFRMHDMSTEMGSKWIRDRFAIKKGKHEKEQDA